MLYYDAENNQPTGTATITAGSDSNTIATTITNLNGTASTLNQVVAINKYAPVITSPNQVTIVAGEDLLSQASAQQLGPNGVANVTLTSSTIDNKVAGTLNQTLTATNTVTGAQTTFIRRLIILPDLAVFQISNTSIGTFSVGSGIPSNSTLLAGLSATLPLEGAADKLITVSTLAVNTNAAGTYTVTYQVVSPLSSAFVATVTRTITYQ